MSIYINIITLIMILCAQPLRPPIDNFETSIFSFGLNVKIPFGDDLISSPFTNTREIYFRSEFGNDFEALILGTYKGERLAYRVIATTNYEKGSAVFQFQDLKKNPNDADVHAAWDKLFMAVQESGEIAEVDMRSRKIILYERISGVATIRASAASAYSKKAYQTLIDLFDEKSKQ